MAGSLKLNGGSGSVTLQTNNPTGNYTATLPNSTGNIRIFNRMVCTYTLANNTNPAATVATTWTTYPLNTVEYNDSDASLGSNTITLSAGLYEVRAFLSNGVSTASLAFRVKTSTGNTYKSTSSGSRGYPLASTSAIECMVSHTSSFTLNIEYWAASANANGLGYPTNDGTNEVYARVIITKLG